jgi:hypothetical protein
MTRMGVPLIAILAAFLVIQCSDNGATVGPDTSGIVGTWNWVRSCGGWTGDCIYPGSTYAHQVLHLYENSRYAWYVADSVYLQGSYHVETREPEPGRKVAVLIMEYEPPQFVPKRTIDFVSRDSLVLTDDCSDCFTSVYHRVEPI